MDDLRPGIYKHFKGPLYEVFFVAEHSETKETFVVYESLEKGTMWVRPVAMFIEQIERGGYKGPRFQYIDKVE
jgi:hypothetical protein